MSVTGSNRGGVKTATVEQQHSGSGSTELIATWEATEDRLIVGYLIVNEPPIPGTGTTTGQSELSFSANPLLTLGGSGSNAQDNNRIVGSTYQSAGATNGVMGTPEFGEWFGLDLGFSWNEGEEIHLHLEDDAASFISCIIYYVEL